MTHSETICDNFCCVPFETMSGNSVPCIFVCLTACFCSTLQDGFELPSRLAVSAADCFLALTEALTKKVLSNRPTSNSGALNRVITLVPASDKKAKPASKSLEVSNMEMEYLFWDHLEELINIVQKLLAVCSILMLPFFGSKMELIYFLFELCPLFSNSWGC